MLNKCFLIMMNPILPEDLQVSCGLHPNPTRPDLAGTGNFSVPDSASLNILRPCPPTCERERQLRMLLKTKFDDKHNKKYFYYSSNLPTPSFLL